MRSAHDCLCLLLVALITLVGPSYRTTAQEPKEKPSVTVSKATLVAERLVVDKNLKELDTFKNGYFVHIRCTVTTRQPNLTIGSPKGRKAKSDVVEFKDFNILYQKDKKTPVVALGHSVLGSVTLYLSPDEFGNIVNFNDQKEYSWEVDVVFVLPKGTREVQFTFKAQEPISIKIPESLEE